MSHISSVSIVTRLWAGQLGLISSRGQDIFIFSVESRPALGPTQPPVQGAPGAVSLEVNQQWHEAENSPPSSGKIKNSGGIPALIHMPSWRTAQLTTEIALLFFLHYSNRMF
jgi:hypothetical protein